MKKRETKEQEAEVVLIPVFIAGSPSTAPAPRCQERHAYFLWYVGLGRKKKRGMDQLAKWEFGMDVSLRFKLAFNPNVHFHDPAQGSALRAQHPRETLRKCYTTVVLRWQ